MSELLLNKIQDLDPNDSELIKTTLSLFYQKLSSHHKSESAKYLYALESIIIRFPKFCVAHKNTIETYLLDYLETSNFVLAIRAAKCIHALQQVRSPSEKSESAQSRWRNLTKALCFAVHSLIDAIFPNAVVRYRTNRCTELDEFFDSPFYSALKEITTVQGKSLKKNAALVEPYPVAKPVRPQAILEVIARALNVTSLVNNSDVNLFAIKIETLRTLNALIACLGTNLVPFSALVFRCIVQTLKWTSEHSSDEARQVRCVTYNAMCKWLTMLKVHRLKSSEGKEGARTWQDELTTHIMKDITPHARVIQLTMSTKQTKNLSKKAKRRLANTTLQESPIASHMPGAKSNTEDKKENEEVAIAALECAEILLTVCGMFFNISTHKLYQERLARDCLNVQAFSAKRAIATLRALEACRKSSPPGVPPPTQYCLHVYSALVANPNVQISKFCMQALLDIRLHLHCSPPSLNFDIDGEKEKQPRAQPKIFSERNVAALESLLGANRLQLNKNGFSDEPASKKPRVDESMDKISLSSDSANSIEINDSEDDSSDDVEEVIDAVINEKDEAHKEVNVILMPTNSNRDECDGNQNDMSTESSLNDGDVIEIANVEQESTDKPANDNLNEALTQLPAHTFLNTSTEYAEKSDSPEVVYDDANNHTDAMLDHGIMPDHVLSLDKVNDIIPSSIDSEDQITCGQVVQSSQECDPKFKVSQNKDSLENNIEIVDNDTIENECEVKDKDVNVEEMMADFVDEIDEDAMEAN